MNTHAHREAQAALPWLANGTLAGAELERVEAHVHGCGACRAELAMLHTLRAAGEPPLPALDMDTALARLMPQLDAALPMPSPVPGWRARFAANDRSWLRAAVALQCCAIAVLAGLLLRPSAGPSAPPADYHLMGACAVAQAALIVSFKPDTPEQELRRIVLASGARIVGGPTATGAWLLGADADPATVAARLHREPAVTLAEPLAAESRP